MKRIVRITESQLQSIIKRSINESASVQPLKPGASFSIIQSFGTEKTINIIAKKYGVNPKYFIVKNGMIIYTPHRTTAKRQKTNISKPVNMSNEEYTNKVVIPHMIEKGKEEFANLKDEEWRPLPNKGRYFRGELDPSEFVEVSNMGRVRIINCANGNKSKIGSGYYAPTRGAVQFHLNATDSSGQPLRTTGFIANMIFDAFVDPEGELDPNKVKIIYIDGNPRNCRLDNLDFEIGDKPGRKIHKMK